ncbi:MAG: apolipoprotein N-acyltransferase [Elusimicrobiota bacterium]
MSRKEYLIFPPLTILSSFLLFLSSPGIDIWPLAFLSLIPFFWVLKKSPSLFKTIFYSFLFGAVFYSSLLYWLIPTMRAGGVSYPLAFFSLLGLSFLLSTEFIIPSLLSFFVKKLGCLPWALILASSWVLTDFLKIQINKWLPWFPWFNMAVTQHNDKFLLPYAFYFGIYGFSFFMIFFQASLAFSLENKKTFLGKLLFFSGLIFAAAYSPFGKNLELSGEKIKIALIQPSVELYKKWDASYVKEIMETNENLSIKAAKEKPDVIIWPENALPGWINEERLFLKISSLAQKTSSYHIIGSVSSQYGKHVSAFLISPEGKISGEYRKIQLVPFGEYVPFRSFLGEKIEALGAMGEFEKGSNNQSPFNIKNFLAGPSICYESAFDYLFYSQKQKGADFFFNITNDGWYFDTLMPYQHLALAKIRAAENRIFLVRAANNGISAFIGPLGDLKIKSNLNDKTFLVFEIEKIKNTESVFPKFFLVYLSLIILVSFLAARIILL